MHRAALPGERFGRLIIVSADGQERRCRCDCGTETVVLRSNLTSGNTASCGCLRREVEKTASVTHGGTRAKKWSRAYTVWHGMIQRCSNPRRTDFIRYGGRGITVCHEWRESFEVFLADMGEPPIGRSLDRIDNDGHYSKQNCAWFSEIRQQRNRRSSRMLTFGGRTQTLAEWAEELGVPYFTLHARLRRGWPVERALSEGGNVL